jgi:ABC-2 type transport system ATP-binding protein
MKIQVQNLSFSYGTSPVLNISNTAFEEGKIYAIVGKTGVGKTTFFKAITNIVTNYTGKVLIDGIDVKQNLSLLSQVGIVLDDMELYKSRTGMFNLRYFGGLRGGFDLSYALKLADELELSQALNMNVSSYSLGMSKKLILLISLMSSAKILIFDEPFRGLDLKTVEWFRQHLLNLKSENRLILISSHVQEDIETLSDRVLVLSKGDFISEFDLQDPGQTFMYKMETDNPKALATLLAKHHIAYEEQREFAFTFNINQEKYEELFKEAVGEGIIFYQIKRESLFTQYIT